MVVNNVEDEKNFSTINFMKSKLHNHLTTHLNLVVWMYAQKFYKLKIFPFYTTIKEWGKKKLHYGEQSTWLEIWAFQNLWFCGYIIKCKRYGVFTIFASTKLKEFLYQSLQCVCLNFRGTIWVGKPLTQVGFYSNILTTCSHDIHVNAFIFMFFEI